MDSLLPLMLAVVVRANLPRLAGEVRFLLDFLDQDLAPGELQVLLTTLHACYQHLLYLGQE
jgi:hypothetical protein